MARQERVLFKNGTIVTGESVGARAQALLVEGETIVATGRPENLGRPDRIVDLGGATIVPGFDDCHMHVLSLGLSLQQLDLSFNKTPAIPALLRCVEDRCRAPGDDWVRGRGYNQNLLPERRHPNRYDLDPVSHDHPVALWHTSGHVATFNSRALELAGIDRNTPDPDGGHIERDAAGVPTGVMKERAVDLVSSVIPDPSPDEARGAIVQASSVLVREGITSASDAATGQHAGIDAELRAYRAALESGELRTRIVVMPVAVDVADCEGEDPLPPPGDLDAGAAPAWLKVGPLKIFSDGALTTRTAAVIEPYTDRGNGLLTWPPDRLTSIITRAHCSGWQIASHAIGDRAIEGAVEAYESAQLAHPRADARHRIEHCTLASPAQIERMRSLAVVVILQPEDIAVLGDAYPSALGHERAAHNSPVGWFERQGVRIAFSSDRPVTPGHPLLGIRAAVERRTAAGDVLGAEHCVPAERAVQLYTAGSAYATFSDQLKGRLLPGLAADFVALDRDITTCEPQTITEARVVMTVVGGRAVYEC